MIGCVGVIGMVIGLNLYYEVFVDGCLIDFFFDDWFVEVVECEVDDIVVFLCLVEVWVFLNENFGSEIVEMIIERF